MRIGDYTVIAIKDLVRQKLRSFLTTTALVISTLILVVMAAISLGGQQAIVSQYGSSNDSLTAISVTPNQNNGSLSPFGTVQQVNNKAEKLDDTAIQTLVAIPSVTSAVPRADIWEINNFTIEGSAKQFVAHAEGVTADGVIALAAGSWFSADDIPSVVVGMAYAKELGYENNPAALVGKTIRLTTQKGYRGEGATLPPVGASQAANDEFNQSTTQLEAKIIAVSQKGIDQNSLLIPMNWARSIRTARFSEPAGEKRVDQLKEAGYSSVRLVVNDVANVRVVSEAVTAAGYGQIATLAQVEKLQQFSTTMWVILGTVALIAVIAAALGVANTMLMSVSEQRYIIGVWRAVGAKKSIIVRLFLIQAAILGLIGGLIGAGLGIVVGYYINDYVAALLSNQGLAVTTIALFPVWLLAGAVILTTIFGVLAGLYPAYKAARQDTSAALTGGQ